MYRVLVADAINAEGLQPLLDYADAQVIEKK